MAKPIDLRLPGIGFEDAVRRMLHTPPPPTSKKAKQKSKSTKSRRAKK